PWPCSIRALLSVIDVIEPHRCSVHSTTGREIYTRKKYPRFCSRRPVSIYRLHKNSSDFIRWLHRSFPKNALRAARGKACRERRHRNTITLVLLWSSQAVARRRTTT
ncbi:unnamed protein product, partial [Amoebophrya sp. A120]